MHLGRSRSGSMETNNRVELRRLDPDADETYIREAVAWLDEQPLFYQNCDAAWGAPESADDYLNHMRDGKQADFGVFDGDKFIAVVTVTLEAKDTYNSHLMVKRGSSVEAIAIGAASVLKGLFEKGMKEGWSWLAQKNHGARKIIEAIGMVEDGVQQIKGVSHGQPITWCRYSVRAAV